MAPKPLLVKITDFETSFDAFPVSTDDGEVIWSDVRIDYALPAGLTPQVTIRVPVPWSPYETTEQRRSKALRSARELIDHACRASAIGSPEAATKNSPAAEGLESVTPPALKRVAQKLDLLEPANRPSAVKR